MQFTTQDLLPRAIAHVQAQRDEYESEVRDWYEHGDGRAPEFVELDDGSHRKVNIGGQGLRFPRCIHGTNLWVDHDIPCGACEGDDRTDLEIATDLAETIARQVNERSVYLSYRPDGMPSDLTTALIDWAFAPLARIQPRKD